MTDIGDGLFHMGEPVWVMQDDGSQRAAEYVGVRETSAWFGGAPTGIVVYPDTRSSAAVEVDRVIPREAQDYVVWLASSRTYLACQTLGCIGARSPIGGSVRLLALSSVLVGATRAEAFPA